METLRNNFFLSSSLWTSRIMPGLCFVFIFHRPESWLLTFKKTYKLAIVSYSNDLSHQEYKNKLNIIHNTNFYSVDSTAKVVTEALMPSDPHTVLSCAAIDYVYSHFGSISSPWGDPRRKIFAFEKCWASYLSKKTQESYQKILPSVTNA